MGETREGRNNILVFDLNKWFQFNNPYTELLGKTLAFRLLTFVQLGMMKFSARMQLSDRYLLSCQQRR